VVLLDPFRGMRAWRNSTETQQSGHTTRFGPEVKDGRSGAEDGAPERLRRRAIQEEVSQILQMVSAGQELKFEFTLVSVIFYHVNSKNIHWLIR